MKKFLISLISLTLIVPILSPLSAKAENLSPATDYQYQVIVNEETYNLDVSVQGNTQTIAVDDGNVTETIVHDMESDEIYANGEKVSRKTITSLEEIAGIERTQSNPNDNSITPYANEIGAGFGAIYVYEFTDYGEINFGSITTHAIIGILAAIFTKNLIVGGLAAVASAISGSITSERKTIYYKHNRYSRPDPNWPLLYKDYREEVWFYKYKTYTGLITKGTFYR